MATDLTTTAIRTRKLIRYTIYFFIFLFIARISLNIGGNIYTKLFPPGPPPATLGFSRLSPIPFPERGTGLQGVEVRAETPSGGLPELPEQAKVFFMPPPTTTLFSLERARARAKGAGFTLFPTETTPTALRFNHPQVPMTMEMDIVSGAFSVSYNLISDPSPLVAQAPNAQLATNSARQFFASTDSLPKDLTGPVTQEFIKAQGRQMVRALSLSEADFVRVNFFRAPASEVPTVTPRLNEANVTALVSGSRETNRRIISADYRYFPVDFSRFETYPLKTAVRALEDLLAGKGYVINLGFSSPNQVVIRRVYLAYYDPDEPSEFYQPVVVFEGDGDFRAVVPAVTDEYYGE